MPLTLSEKIAQAAAEVGDVAKLGDNGEYTYIRASDLFREIRLKLFTRGVTITPIRIVDIQRSQPYVSITDNIIDEVMVTVEYAVTDGTETLTVASAGCGQDYKGKALPIALTGALKSLLKVLGLIAATEDDPETVNEGRIPDALAQKLDEAEKEFGHDLREHPISRRDVVAWGVMCSKAGIKQGAREKYLKDHFGVDKISDLKRKDFPEAVAWTAPDEQPTRVDS